MQSHHPNPSKLGKYGVPSISIKSMANLSENMRETLNAAYEQ
jgi:hypothetical protein